MILGALADGVPADDPSDLTCVFHAERPSERTRLANRIKSDKSSTTTVEPGHLSTYNLRRPPLGGIKHYKGEMCVGVLTGLLGC